MINTTIKKPSISKNFTIDDIHKIREYNYEMTKDMSREEIINYYKTKADKALVEMGLIK